MSGLRYFSDLMHEQIRIERRLTEISNNAERYVKSCQKTRTDELREHRRLSSYGFMATEGTSAARIILGHKQQETGHEKAN